MKPVARELTVVGQLPGERIGLSINAEDLPHIMGLLTDLYNDPVLAIIREYSTNALDAHREVGETRPIEVTTPTTLAPFLKIKDYGPGLDVLDIREIYSRYGASTKRNSNDVVGMLGLGCKSALTYTDQFTISAVKNGFKIEVAVSRDEDGGGHMKPVDQYATDEPNGVEIIIPAAGRYFYDFEEKAKNFFKYWDKGTVLLNGEEPERIDGFWVADDLLVVNERNANKIVMGNVAYPIPSDYSMSYYSSLVAFVDIGDVYFTPSRESLQMNSQTKATIERVFERLANEAQAKAQETVETATSRPDAILKATEMERIFNEFNHVKLNPEYKGEKIPDSFSSPKTQQFVTVTGNKAYRSKGWSRNRYHNTAHSDTLYITGYNGTDFSPYKRKKMNQWLAEKGLETPQYLVFTSTLPDRKWIDKTKIHPWAEIDAQKIVREKTVNQNGRLSGSYEAYVDGEWVRELEAKDIDYKKPVLWVRKIDGFYNDSKKILEEFAPEYTVVLLGGNRIAKFERDFPMAQNFHEFVKGLAKTWADNLSDDDKLTLKILLHDLRDYQYNLSTFNKVKVTFDDPALNLLVKVANEKVNSKLMKGYNKFGNALDLSDIEWEDPLPKYPLLAEISTYGTMSEVMQEHVKMYANAVYAAEQEDQNV